MNPQLLLESNVWENQAEIYVAGCILFNDEIKTVTNLYHSLVQYCKEDKLTDLVSSFTGQYSIIINLPEKFILISSPGQFFPVFYKCDRDNCIISDRIQNFHGTTEDHFSRQAFLYSANTPDNHTLLKDVFVNPSGCITQITHYQISTTRFFNYAVKASDIFVEDQCFLKEKAKNQFFHVFERCVKMLQGRTAVVPLSGGYDSRLILTALTMLNYPKIIAVTYGKPGNKEAIRAEKVVSKLGVKWFNIESTDSLVDSLFEKKELVDYIMFAFNGKSSVCLHEFYAVKYLKQKSLIPEDSVFLPGHSGDLLGGSQLIKVIPPDIKYEAIAKWFVKKKFGMYKPDRKMLKSFETFYQQLINERYSKDYLPYSIFEDMDLSERIPKFILNASQVFRYWGYDVITPYWDIELLTFFSKIPLEMKKGKWFYNEVLSDCFFTPNHVVIENELAPTIKQLYISNLKRKIRPFLPFKIKQKFLIKNDLTNYTKITHPLSEDLTNHQIWQSGNDYNEIINQWILNNYHKYLQH